MNIERVIEFSRRSGISVHKVRKAFNLPQPAPSLHNMASAHRRYELAPYGSKEEHDALESLLHHCKKAVESASTIAEAKIAHEFTPTAEPLKIESLNKWRLLAYRDIMDCTEPEELQKLLFLIPPDTEEELLAIQKLAALL
jgi:hypothetical protein